MNPFSDLPHFFLVEVDWWKPWEFVTGTDNWMFVAIDDEIMPPPGWFTTTTLLQIRVESI